MNSIDAEPPLALTFGPMAVRLVEILEEPLEGCLRSVGAQSGGGGAHIHRAIRPTRDRNLQHGVAMHEGIIGHRDLPHIVITEDLSVRIFLTDAPRHDLEDVPAGAVDCSGSQTLVARCGSCLNGRLASCRYEEPEQAKPGDQPGGRDENLSPRVAMALRKHHQEDTQAAGDTQQVCSHQSVARVS